VPFVAYIHAQDGEPPEDGREAWEPNWRLWRWVIAAVVFAYAATRSHGAFEFLLVMIVFACGCRALVELLPDGDGLREHRQ
jgi:hypothetical protein